MKTPETITFAEWKAYADASRKQRRENKKYKEAMLKWRAKRPVKPVIKKPAWCGL